MKSVTLLGRLTTGVVISGLLMLGISSCTDSNVAVTGNAATKPVDVSTIITTESVTSQTLPVQNAINSNSTGTLANEGIVMPSLPAGTPVNTLTDPLSDSTVVPSISFEAPSGSSLSLNTTNVGAGQSGLQLISNVGTSGGNVNMSTGNTIVPLVASGNGSSINTSSSLVIPVGTNSLVFGAISGGNFVAGSNTNSLAPIELNDEDSALSATRLKNRPKILLTGYEIRFNTRTRVVSGIKRPISTLPNKQSWKIARELNTGVATTLGSKLTINFDDLDRPAPIDGKVTMRLDTYNSNDGTSAVLLKTVPVLNNIAVITDDGAVWPSFTSFSFKLDLRDNKTLNPLTK